MAALLLLLILSTVSTSTAQIQSTNITLGSSLSSNSDLTHWLSPSSRFAFGFYPISDGFKVGIWIVGSPSNTIVWTANRDSPPAPRGATLLLSDAGGLILTSGQHQAPLVPTTQNASRASMLDSGNFVIYNSRSEIIWESFDFPTDTILATQTLPFITVLFSHESESNHSIGRFRIVVHSDGNFVSYPTDTTNTSRDAYWISDTSGIGGNASLHLDNDGRLYIANSTGFNIKNFTQSRTTTAIYRATLDVDGIFRLYSHPIAGNGSISDGSAVWATISPGDSCIVKGACGFNSYCAIDDSGSSCQCPQGFDYVDPNQQFKGCEASFITEKCRGVQEGVSYDVSMLENTKWEDDQYALLMVTGEEECKQACLVDCDCMAAMFSVGSCTKQKLPLRYGRRNISDSTVAFIKIGSGSPENNPPSSKKKTIGKEVLIAGLVLIGFSSIILIISSCLIYKRQSVGYGKIPENTCPTSDPTGEVNLKSFTYEELAKATDSFKEEVGRGSFGKVYKGYLPNATKKSIAVKKLENLVEEGEREFEAEMRAIGRTHHRNLIRLIGFCNEGSNRLLVYEYMSNGSLADLLFRDEQKPPWIERERIALDVARGIHYLHEECGAHIIHCDIKPQNILMDEKWNARISDFGLAKLLMPDQTKTYTGIRGTRGYVAPEWHKSAPITTKADVYSYGIVLLEIVCCRRHVDTKVDEEEAILLNWVCDCFEEGKLSKLVGDEDVEKSALERMVKVALCCIQEEPVVRPTMKKVILMLEGTIATPNLPSPTSLPNFDSNNVIISGDYSV